MRIRIATIDEWQSLLEARPSYSFHQRPEWSLACQQSARHAMVVPRMFLFDDGTEVLMPLVEVKIRSLFKTVESVPAGYGGPLCVGTPTPQHISSIMAHLKKGAAMATVHPHPAAWRLFNEADLQGFTLKRIHTYLAPCYQGSLEQRANYDVKESIEEALAKGMEVYEGSVSDLRHPYYDIYAELCRTVGRSTKDMINPAFFEKLMAVGGKNVRLFFTRQGREALCGTIIGYGKGECHRIHSAYRYNRTAYHAMNLLLWHILQDASNRGYQSVNLGAGRPDDLTGDKYKELFGAERLDYGYYVYESPWWQGVKRLRQAIG